MLAQYSDEIECVWRGQSEFPRWPSHRLRLQRVQAWLVVSKQGLGIKIWLKVTQSGFKPVFGFQVKAGPGVGKPKCSKSHVGPTKTNLSGVAKH